MVAHLVQAHHDVVGDLEVAEVASHRDVVDHGAAGDEDAPAVAGGAVHDDLHAGDQRCERRDDDAPLGGADVPIEGLSYALLGRSEALHLDVGGVDTEEEGAVFAQVGEAGEVCVLAEQRGVVNLEVAGVDDGAERGLDDEAGGVRDGVGDGEELHGEGANIDDVAGLDDVELGAVEEAVFLQLHLDEAAGELEAEDGDFDIAEEEGDGANVVLVPVGEEDGLEAIDVVEDVGEVRDDEVDAGVFGIREEEADIDGDHGVAVLVDHHVAADFAEAAERDDAEDAVRDVGTG